MFRRHPILRMAYLLVTGILLAIVIWYFLRYIKLMDSLTANP